MTCHQNSSNQPDDSDKGSKHVEMFRTKCQPKVGTDKMPTKSWDGQNANHRKKSGWHLVWLAFCPVGILSYHPIQPHELVTHSKEKLFKCDHCNFSSTQVFYLKRHKHNHARDKPFKRYQCNYSPTQSGKVSQHNF